MIEPQRERDMKKGIRRGLIITGSVLAVMLVVAVALVVVVRRPFPKTRGTLRAAGLSAPVEIVRDPAGVPHLTAASMHDLYFAQGFVHAQDRFWQMEFWRRIGSGRLSELFGEATLGTDLYLRTMGFRRFAEEEYAAASVETRAVLDAYAEGVNAYIDDRSPGRLGLEFAFLRLQGVRFDVEPWTPVNSLTWLKIMAQDLGNNMNRELYALDLLHTMGSDLSADYFGVYRPGMPYIVADDELPPSLLDARPGTAAGPSPDPADLAGVPTRLVGGFDLSAGLALGTGAGIGSNSWVIAGSRTASGRPILANDPHLGIQMPSIWYEIDLACTATEAQPGKNAGSPFHVRGFSFPGTPCVIVGHNDRISWGVTNLGPDVQDLYIERINPANPDQYEVNGRWVDMTVRREQIRVEGKDEPFELLVRQTRHGPIVTDEGGYAGYRGYAINPRGAYPANIELKALALRWTALQPNTTLEAVIGIDRARNFAEFRQALRSWDIPSQNFVYADVDGNIGYQAPGLIPVRARGDGSLPVPGWTDDFAWKGFIPFEELPWSYNPPKGYVVTANNAVASPNYRHFIAGEFDFGYRARRIAAMIEGAEGKLTVADVQAMQNDTLDEFALEVVPYLAALDIGDPAVAAARDLLAGWDGRMDPDSAGAALYSYFWVALVEEALDDQIPRELWDPGTGLENNSRQMNTIAQLLPRPENGLWDRRTTPDVRESRDDILAAALARAVKRGTGAQGERLERWRWGREHTAVFRNQSLGESGIALVERIFNRGPVAVGGGFQQVNCTDYKVNEPFGVYAVSSLRQVIDLAYLGGSRTIHTTGQSGHAFHRHYADFIDDWAGGRYHPTLWDVAALRAAGGRRLVLEP
jgi:penicillin amidase